MTNSEIPEDVRSFLLKYVHTYEQLETLLLLHDHAGQHWTARALSDALNISASAASETLQELSTNRLLALEADPPLTYSLARPDVMRIVRSMARLYKENRLLIMQLMNENALERIRTGALRVFADAFLIGGRKKNG